MSKYDSLWKWIQKNGDDKFSLTYAEIEKIAGLPIDHSFLTYKKELPEYGYKVVNSQHDTKRIAHVTSRFFLFFISFDTLKSAGRKFFKGKELEK